jgi:type III restriction enzyme
LLSGTKDFEKLRNAEANKVCSGRLHFEAWDVDFSVVKSAGEMGELQCLPSFACL